MFSSLSRKPSTVKLNLLYKQPFKNAFERVYGQLRESFIRNTRPQIIEVEGVNKRRSHSVECFSGLAKILIDHSRTAIYQIENLRINLILKKIFIIKFYFEEEVFTLLSPSS